MWRPQVLRCIDNETIQPDELSDLKDDMDAYLVGRGKGYGYCLSS